MPAFPHQRPSSRGPSHPWQQTPEAGPSSSTSTTKIVLMILAIVMLISLLICGGLVGFGWYAMNRLQEVIVAEMNAAGEDPLMEEALIEAIAEDPTLQKEVGEIREIRYDSAKTARATDEDDWYIWYVVEGTDGIASLRALESDEPERWFDSVELEKPGGELVPLELQAVPYYEWAGERDVIQWVEQDPELQPLVGTVRAIRTDDERTASETDPEVPVYWYEIKGDAGTLPVLVTFAEDDYTWFETVASAEVEMPDGTRRNIAPEPAPPQPTNSP